MDIPFNQLKFWPQSHPPALENPHFPVAVTGGFWGNGWTLLNSCTKEPHWGPFDRLSPLKCADHPWTPAPPGYGQTNRCLDVYRWHTRHFNTHRTHLGVALSQYKEVKKTSLALHLHDRISVNSHLLCRTPLLFYSCVSAFCLVTVGYSCLKVKLLTSLKKTITQTQHANLVEGLTICICNINKITRKRNKIWTKRFKQWRK